MNLKGPDLNESMKDLVRQNIRRFKTDNPFTGFAILVAVICILNIVLNIINGRFWMSDFKVYYMAAKTMLSGGQVYLQSFADGSGFYKYSPVILFFFLPYCVFNYTVASVIHFFILSFAFWYTFLTIRKILTIYFPIGAVRKEGLLLSLSFLCIILHLVRELYLGNINILLLLLCSLALRNYVSKKPLSGSILLGIVLLTKPFYLILIIPLVLRKYWKALSWSGLVLAAGFMLTFIFPGPERSITLYSEWIKTMLIHDQSFPGMNSMDYILQQYFFRDLPAYSTYIIILIAGTGVSFFILLNQHQEQKHADKRKFGDRNFIFEWFFIIALIPDIVKTDSEHFLSTAPLLVFIIYYIAMKRKYWLVPVLIVLLFFYGGNSTDLLGRNLSMRLFSMGLLGLSNILIVIVSLFLFLDYRKDAVQSG
jgi:hypothetical protein